MRTGIAVTVLAADATTALHLPTGGQRAVLEASAAAVRRVLPAVLAVVVATEGSTYVRPGAMAMFGEGIGQVGWLSGGCLEPEIERRALLAQQLRRIDWLDIDTRDDEDLLSGSAVGCRGRLHVALIPLALLPRWDDVVAAWFRESSPLQLRIRGDGELVAIVEAVQLHWTLAVAEATTHTWAIAIPPPPAVLLFGAGPETPTLLPLLRNLGWSTTLVERRPRWVALARLADVAIAQSPEAGLSQVSSTAFDAALVMHHNFELDREALAALASRDIGFVGLLGPTRRREDLFRVLSPQVHDAMRPRLHSPVGLDLGGHGPEAIALSIAAQLHAFRHAP